MFKIKLQDWAFSRQGAKDKAIVKSKLKLWECPTPLGFTHGKAQGKGYHEVEYT
jgi:hypothetical protein